MNAELYAKDPSGEFRPPEVQELVDALRDRMAGMSLLERHQVRENVFDGFCDVCACTTDVPCDHSQP